MVNEATCAALAPAFISTSAGAASPLPAEAELPQSPRECSDDEEEDSSSCEGNEKKEERDDGLRRGARIAALPVCKRSRSGFGDESSREEGPSPTPPTSATGCFHGYPCPRCGMGVGFNAKKCKGCNQLCAYSTTSSGATGRAGHSGRISSSSSLSSLASTKGLDTAPASSLSSKKRPRNDTAQSVRPSAGAAARGGRNGVRDGGKAAEPSPSHKGAHVGRDDRRAAADDGVGGEREGHFSRSLSGLLNADGDQIYITTDYEHRRTTGGTSSGGGASASEMQSQLLPGQSALQATPSSSVALPSFAESKKMAGVGSRIGSSSGSNHAGGSEPWSPPAMTGVTATGIAVPPATQPHPELLSPLLSSSIGRAGLVSYVTSLRSESVQRVARPLLTRIMAHSLNRNLFNRPVDATGLPDYHLVVKNPKDLGTVKGQLLSAHYDQLEPFVADVRLVFSNAMAYNPPHNHVHKSALAMSAEFEDELRKLAKKLERDERRRVEHSCSLCQGQECGLCGEKCLKLEPVMLQCSGACTQRIKRGAPFFITRDGARLWCQKCHTGLSSVLPPPSCTGDPDLDVADPDFSPDLFYKRDLLKRVYDEDIPEPWVMCDSCQGWFHQPCALYNKLYEQGLGDLRDSCVFCCPLCRLGSEAKRLPPPWLHQARNWFAELAVAETSSSKSGSGGADSLSSSSSLIASSSALPAAAAAAASSSSG